MYNSVRPHRQKPTRPHRPWDSPGKNIGVGCHFLLQCMKVESESEVPQSCPTLATSWTTAYQAPLSMGFPRQEYWHGLSFPSLGKLPDPGIKSASPALQVDSLRLSHQGSLDQLYKHILNLPPTPLSQPSRSSYSHKLSSLYYTIASN